MPFSWAVIDPTSPAGLILSANYTPMATDSVLVIGETDPKLPLLLKKLGYQLFAGKDPSHVSSTLSRTIIDLILIDADLSADPLELCRYFHNDQASRDVPIVVVAENEEALGEIREEFHQTIECLARPCSAGLIVGKVATQLRLRKMSGAENPHASLAATNASLRDHNEHFKEEREQSRAIQESLLPRSMPSHDTYEFGIRFKPLDEVGGDWYFTQCGSDGGVAFQVLDVTGHGLSAALIGSMAKLAIAAGGHPKPQPLLEAVNRLLTPHLPEGRFITMTSAFYSPDGKLSFSRAGHPPALVLHRAKNTVERLKPAGFAIGFTEEARFPETATQLERGDIAAFFTDGISEGQNRASDLYNFEGIEAAMKRTTASMTASDIVNSIVADFEKFLDGRRLNDDLTLIVLKRTK